jgi:hypothetical protein
MERKFSRRGDFRMTRATKIFALAALGCLMLWPAPSALAQGEAHGKYYTKADVDRIIKRVEERSDSFRRVVDRSLDRGALDGTRREDNINEQVKEMEGALDDLRSKFDRTDTWQDTRSQVQKVLDEADEVNAIMNIRRRRFGKNVREEWALVRRDLNTLADVYNLRKLR